MRCLVFVRFLPGGSLPPEEFFARVNAEWSILDNESGAGSPVGHGTSPRNQSPRSAMCIADYDSVEQLGLDLAILPGAGLSAVEVVPMPDVADTRQLWEAVPAGGWDQRRL